MCTGTLIADDKVLTAAHCVYNIVNNKFYRNNKIFLASIMMNSYLILQIQ
ncbi:trypsin-like serine protease [Bacillus aquiflavi]|uniref:Trypsin-like serine protease n=1 Tax=Bacillus aquiflavi TaxID=2672567 RepID=A0A6B3W0H2_9BACI|nr:trypsin-like serine protease [Bacillus aquiflavi]NEY82998.1 trypsin-like serine protease [Bacillus aquiflavi]